MQFVIIGNDKNDALQTRKNVRADHLAYWGEQGKNFLAAGPFLDKNENPCGSMMIVEAGDIDEAKRMAASDPYVTGGVFENYEVRRWNWLLGKPELI
ncbi:hypothetical protein MNBD_ALPHA11-314 [hydrothermal vent metagenome]|uniref:YCII-related domain-containing protein n=1 Tax=hydrothermal vent metagenome TaxID=652676 RepID=A0A3B0UZB0_9ZZZZ